MKVVRKTILTIPVFLLYCLLVAQYSPVSGSKPADSQSDNRECYSFVYEGLSTLSHQTEESIYCMNKTPQTSLKTTFDKSVAFSQCVESFWTSSVSRYFFWIRNATIRLLSLDLIFPFHTFW